MTINDIKTNLFYTPLDIALITNMGYSTITKHIRLGNIKAIQPTGLALYRVKGKEILNWVGNQSKEIINDD